MPSPETSNIAVHRCRFIHYLSPAITNISFNAQSQTLAVARANGNIVLYHDKQASTWYQTLTLSSNPKQGLQAVSWVGKRLFSAGLDGNIYEWDLATGRQKYFTSSYGGAVWSIKAAPAPMDSQGVLAVGCEDGFIRLFRVVDDGLEYLSALERQSTKVLCMAWHPRKPILVVGGTDGKARVIHVDTGRTVHTLALDAAYQRSVGQEATIVWDVLVLDDGTIVTADSLGHVSFWHGPSGTLLQKLASHEADVLCLAASKDRVFSSGVDRKVCEFTRMNQDGNSASTLAWVASGCKRYHTHDVSCLVYLERPRDCLISGGLDTTLIISGPVKEFGKMKQQRLGMIPQCSPVALSTEKRLMSCMFDDSIRVWRVSRNPELTGSVFDRQRVEHEPHKHVLTINCKGASNLISHDISPDGAYIVAADSSSLRLFHIDTEATPISVELVKSSELDSIRGASKVLFSPTCTSVVIAGLDGHIHIYDLHSHKIAHTFVPSGDRLKSHGLITNLAISDDGLWLLSGDSSRRLVSYSLAHFKQHSVLPNYSLHSSMQFIPNTHDVVITTVSNEIYIINVPGNSLTPWSRAHSHNLPKKFTSRQETISGVAFPKPGHIMVWAPSYTLSIDLAAPVPAASKSEKLAERSQSEAATTADDDTYTWGLNHRFQSLMFCRAAPKTSELFLVERPVLQVLSELPDAWKKRKYGQ
ncbi:U3 small nucleolar RNA-associated protein 4 [Kappamyces sp. JEL0680]|nr:U3 small nucleolar RNA-associated protein 4 [Kappamyces sp. JEL0680]